jgi:hypothetical protein
MAGQPVISIDTKKKELIGPFKNGGGDYRQEGCPDKVNVLDFIDKDLGRLRLMAFMTPPPMLVASVLVSATTQLSSRSIRSVAGWM